MPRKPVYIDAFTTYHTTSQCIDKKLLMKHNGMKAIFLRQIRRALKKYDFEIISFAIEDNHFHLTIRTLNDFDTISVIMQFIKSRFAEIYNKRMNRTGPFWNGRYKAKVIDLSKKPDLHCLRHIWYQGYNSVKSGKVSDPREYKYNSIRAYLEKDFISLLPITLHKAFVELGESFNERVKVFLNFEKAYKLKYRL